MSSKVARVSNSKKNTHKKTTLNRNRNLVYMAKPPYGGWVSFTAHLALKCDYPLFKVGNKTEGKTRPYGYGVEYQNVAISDLVKKPNLLITAIDKNYYQYLPEIKSATIVIHDPTELKEPVLEALKRFKVITIRETVQKLLREKHGIESTFLYHPLYKFPRGDQKKTSGKAISLSRVDFDKHTEMIVEANKGLKMPVEIYGAMNDLYVYHKLRDTQFRRYYKGKFPKTFDALTELLATSKFVVDMSAINRDGGGSQYTFLEAIYMDCALILSSKWVAGVKTPFRHGVNCFVVSSAEELRELLRRNPDTKKIVKNAKRMLAPHLKAKGW